MRSKMRSAMTDDFMSAWKEGDVNCEWLLWLGCPLLAWPSQRPANWRYEHNAVHTGDMPASS